MKLSIEELKEIYESIQSEDPPTHISFYDKNGEWKIIKLGDFTTEEIAEMIHKLEN